MASFQSVNFTVTDNVKPSKPKLDQFKTTPRKLFLDKLCERECSFEEPKDEVKFECISEQTSFLLATETHSLFETWHNAYDRHYPLEISPDHIRLLITQGLSIHINQNSDKLSNLLVDHEGKKTISVDRDDFIKGKLNPWPEVFSQFSDAIKNNIKDEQLIDLLQTNYSTTTINSKAATDIAIMDCFKKYFDFLLTTRCGIPSITVKGTPNDWKSVKELISYLDKFDLSWWTNQMKPIIDKIIETSQNNIDVTFWQNMIKTNNIGSGGPGYDGWFRAFFPYFINYKKEYYKQNFSAKLVFSTEIPTGLSSVPFKWNYLGTIYEMTFYAGFLGMAVDENGIVKPDIHWAIVENK